MTLKLFVAYLTESSTSSYHCVPLIATKLPNALHPEGVLMFSVKMGVYTPGDYRVFNVFTISSLRVWAAYVIINTVNIFNVSLLK